MTQRIEWKIRSYTQALDTMALPVEALLPDGLADEIGVQKPPLLVTATIEQPMPRFRGWWVALAVAAAVVILVMPAMLVDSGSVDREVLTPSSTIPQASTTVTTAASDERNIVWNPVNGHLFEAVAVVSGITWGEASEAAAARTRDGSRGHLATFTSEDEYLFIVENLPEAFDSGPGYNPYWIGGFQPSGSEEPGGGWTWVTGEPFTYAPWGSVEPNNSTNGENCLHPHHDQSEAPRWNDQPCDDATVRGYLVEYEG